ncbi:MAG: hypothetical protein JJT78_18625 [Leptospira sp.]|nr:hypothetical protein [Leptospira sp.]
MYKIFIISIVFFLSSFGISGEEKTVISEYTLTESYYKFNNSPDPDPSKTLELNVKSGLKLAIMRHFPDNANLISRLETEELKYEQILGTRIVIAKFADHIFEFRYSANPRKYHLTPITQKIHKVPVNKENAPKLNESSS